MKNNLSHLILIVSDILAIGIAISFGYFLRQYSYSSMSMSYDEYWSYVANISIYVIVILTFFSEKIYKYRYDFWEETRLVFRGLLVSFLIVFSILALTRSMEEYSRLIILFSFLFMAFFIPIIKNIMKKFLFKIGLWKRKSEILGNDIYIEKEIFGNPYLGYVPSSDSSVQTVLVDSSNISIEELQKKLEFSLQEKKEVLFIPLLQSYNFANTRIIELSNARKNLVVLENALLKKTNVIVKKISDILFSIVLTPFLAILFIIIIALMKKEEPKGRIFFKQKRIGINGKEFICYKFRSMLEDCDERLKEYLKEYPEEVLHYDTYHKYKNDPRVTKIGKFLRKTSLDELPQILNIFQGEMSLIGPRPYMPSEKEKVGESLEMILKVRPGITGLWQVSGRSDVDFKSRVDIDVWYIRNWNLWLDFVILVKTIKVVLFKQGAQ